MAGEGVHALAAGTRHLQEERGDLPFIEDSRGRGVGQGLFVSAAGREDARPRHAEPVGFLRVRLRVDEAIGQVAALRGVAGEERVEAAVAAIPGGHERGQLHRLVEMFQNGQGLVAQRVDLGFRRVPRLREARRENVQGQEQCGENQRPGDGSRPLARPPRGHGAEHTAEIRGQGACDEDPATGDVDGGPEVEVPRERKRQQAEQQQDGAGVTGDPECFLHRYLQRCDAMAVLAVKRPSAQSETK